MKYMGSKRAMLLNGLGDLLNREAVGAGRFVDLFTGSGAVAAFVATRFPISVLAFDLQSYGAVLAGATVARQTRLDWKDTWRNWCRRAESHFSAYEIPTADRVTKVVVSSF